MTRVAGVAGRDALAQAKRELTTRSAASCYVGRTSIHIRYNSFGLPTLHRSVEEVG
jgi:hypothetical protein